MKPHTFVSLIVFFLLCNMSSNGQANKKDSLIRELRKSDIVETKYIGNVGTLSKIYKTAQLLWDMCPIDTLSKLTSDTSPPVRCYALLGLIEKQVDKNVVKEIADKHKNDNAAIKTMNNPGGYIDNTVGEFMIMNANRYGMDSQPNPHADSLRIDKKKRK